MHLFSRSLALLLSLSALMFAPALAVPASAAGCVRFVASNFDAPGNDHYNENAEWVRIKNVCATRKNIGSWTIHDYDRNHTYRFPSTFHIGAGNSVTLYTGKGQNTSSKRYWGYGSAVWNNTPPEMAYLRKPDGSLMSKWTEY